MDKPVLEKRDMQYVGILTNLGIKRHVAKAAVFLIRARSATSREVELGADLRQPEVSIAMKELKVLGWIMEKEIKKKGKGRPLKSYDANVGFTQIVNWLESEKTKECDERRYEIERLKDLTKQFE
ncbi:MAG: ArsR family transcriptional regulator [Euryarchaeota archaeon]|nr:ArsR family transcriptional regulator [Euryarchaeota archaeon]